MNVAFLTFALLGAQTGTLNVHATLGPLTAAERSAHHTHFDKAESIAGFEIEVSPIVHGKPSDTAVSETTLDTTGKLSIKLAPGLYMVTMSHDMYAGAYTDYPSKKIRIKAGKTTRLNLHVRSEYFN
jgi:hypothetical protein